MEENKDKFYRIAYSYVKNQDDALDIVQDAVYKAIIKYDTLRNPEYIKTWFYRILVNCAIDTIRKNRKVTCTDWGEQDIVESGSISDEYIDLRHSLNKLDDNQRVIVVMRFFEDMKIDDIASVLNCNVNTVKTRLYSALKKLRLELEV